MQELNEKKIVLAGGVSANLCLRERLTNMARDNGYAAYVPQLKYCTDNAAMIGSAAYYNFINGKKYDIKEKLDLNAIANLPIDL